MKLSRDISQTPWNLNEEDEEADDVALKSTLKPKSQIKSVQEYLGESIRQEIFGSDEVLLHGSGREDIDVRMLGRGRPFILEFLNP